MNKYQNMILWIGLILVLVYIFANHGGIFTTAFTKSGSTAKPGPALTLADFGLNGLAMGLPGSTGNNQSNSNNSGSAKTVVTV